VVDDDFFKLGQMEEFLQREDRKWMNRENADVIEDNEDSELEEEDIDYFGSHIEEEEENASAADAVYADFFDPIKVATSKTDAKALDPKEDEEEEEKSEYDDEDSSFERDNFGDNIKESKSEKLSSFELSQEKMLKTIKRLEEANLDKKSWQLMGESTASQRPTNSLLEEHVSFEHTSLGAPEITEETTEKIEDLILQRIKDQAWDDVERRLKCVVQPHEYKKAPELNQEKSKLSLAEVYEKEYLDKTKVETEEKESEEHAAIRTSMQKLFSKLDALTNFRFTQKPPNPEVQIVTNTRSLDMEEVTPVAVTETMQLAPEELHEKQRGNTIGDTERTDVDRKRARRKKKLKKKYAVKEKEKKLQEKAAAGDTKSLKIAEKRKAEDSLKKNTHVTMVNGSIRQETTPKSSSDFFNKLQNEAQIAIKKDKNQHLEQKIKKRKTEFLKL
jgi:U3 small nucleolar RNA-associated protein MPP10